MVKMLEDEAGRLLRPILGNTSKEGTGEWYVPLLDRDGRLITGGWTFGIPTLVSHNNGRASWARGSTSPLDQKGSTGWLANLYGGVQTGDDWARINVPVNELLVPDFHTAKWSYNMTATETMGVNIVIWVHDLTDLDKRAEITQLGGVAGLEKAAGWNAHEFDSTDAGMFYYGENDASPLTAGTQYTWAQFQADSVFSTWGIYRITLEYGWEASGTFDDIWVGDLKLNGQLIPLGPRPGSKYRKTVRVQKTLEADGVYAANDVMSESDTASAGTDWDFDFGGIGKIVKAIAVTGLTTATSALILDLYEAPPTCELDDNAAYNGPLVADLPYYVGRITFPALATIGGPASAQAVLADVGASLSFDRPKLYGVLIDSTGEDYDDDETMDIILTAELEV